MGPAKQALGALVIPVYGEAPDIELNIELGIKSYIIVQIAQYASLRDYFGRAPIFGCLNVNHGAGKLTNCCSAC